MRLGLRVGRHLDWFFDVYIGPVDPRLLRDEARALLDALGHADLEDDRRRWLRGQLHALDCVTARLSGVELAWIDEVERCLGVHATRTDPKVFEGVHRRLDAALPGRGTVREPYVAWDEPPGHHTERAAKEALLYRGRGRVETSVVITPAPESLVSEGLAQNALEEALGPEPFGVVADVLGDLDLGFDPSQAHQVHQAELGLNATATNAAFLLHEDGAGVEDAADYLRQWALETDEQAVRTVAFLTDPASRAYVTACPDGWRLCRDFVARAPGNFTRLLTEQLTTSDLLDQAGAERSSRE